MLGLLGLLPCRRRPAGLGTGAGDGVGRDRRVARSPTCPSAAGTTGGSRWPVPSLHRHGHRRRFPRRRLPIGRRTLRSTAPYLSTAVDPWYDASPDGEDRHAVLRGCSSPASSPTSSSPTAAADRRHRRSRRTSAPSRWSCSPLRRRRRSDSPSGPRNAMGCASSASPRRPMSTSSRSLGFYDSVLTYDEIGAIATVDSVVIDMAGNPTVLDGDSRPPRRPRQLLDDGRQEPSRRRRQPQVAGPCPARRRSSSSRRPTSSVASRPGAPSEYRRVAQPRRSPSSSRAAARGWPSSTATVPRRAATVSRRPGPTSTVAVSTPSVGIVTSFPIT